MNDFYRILKAWCENHKIKWPAGDHFSYTRHNIFTAR